MCHDAAHGGLIMEKRVFDSHRAHEFKEYTEVCESVLAHYGTGGGNTPMVLENKEPVLLESNQNHATIREDGISTSLVASAGEGGGYVPMVTQGINGEVGGTLDSSYYKGCGERQGIEREVVAVGNGQTAQMGMHDKTYALDCMHDQQSVMENLVVRRLTPKECSRLQGYPDGWMDIGEWRDSKGKLHKDSDAPKYKAAGNSIALPFWQWLMDRIAKHLKKDGCENPTMASLFDGISGFPLCATRSGIKPVWSSEIEEFPMAVAERHFGENGDISTYL
jgi:DNA (cytosine-5)-methyltransferase 1